MNYRNITSVEQLQQQFGVVLENKKEDANIINEKKGDGKADEDVKQTAFFDKNLEVYYADMMQLMK